jgi:hypothetical protein
MRVLGRETQRGCATKVRGGRPSNEGKKTPRGCTIDRSFFRKRIRVGAHMMGPERCRDLCLHMAKPEETLVEARSDSDVQIDRPM